MNKVFIFLCALQFLFAEESSPWLKPGLLNSTRIEMKFGSYGVEVLAQDPTLGIRVSSLYSEHGGEKITRTIAFTRFEANMDDRLNAAHEEILAGSSIGATLKAHGFGVQKDLLFKGLLEDRSDGRTFATLTYNLLAQEGGN